MSYVKILIYHLSQIVPDVNYSVLVRYRDTLFCHFSASDSFKNIEVILSYLLPVSKSFHMVMIVNISATVIVHHRTLA